MTVAMLVRITEKAGARRPCVTLRESTGVSVRVSDATRLENFGCQGRFPLADCTAARRVSSRHTELLFTGARARTVVSAYNFLQVRAVDPSI